MDTKDNKKQVSIERIQLKVGDEKLSLTLEQARMLKDELAKLFGADRQYPVYVPYQIPTQIPYNPPWYHYGSICQAAQGLNDYKSQAISSNSSSLYQLQNNNAQQAYDGPLNSTLAQYKSQ